MRYVRDIFTSLLSLSMIEKNGKKVEIISGLKEGDEVMVQEIDLTKKEKKSKGAFSGGR